eukprot:5350025-Pyramimonas_sp.AAC.1
MDWWWKLWMALQTGNPLSDPHLWGVIYAPPRRWEWNRHEASITCGSNFVIHEWAVFFQWVHGPLNSVANYR